MRSTENLSFELAIRSLNVRPAGHGHAVLLISPSPARYRRALYALRETVDQLLREDIPRKLIEAEPVDTEGEAINQL
ncbi:Protein STU1 [Fusarium oxysporum f. sp. albedinis]|nr:Protein STU1 [Fusarium oxysporum f. sp. albedinis]